MFFEVLKARPLVGPLIFSLQLLGSIDCGFLGITIVHHSYTLKSVEGFKEHGCWGPIKSESLGWDPWVRLC